MRVIAGSAGGRPLVAPSATKSPIRPTGDKVKGAIFSMLEAEALRRGVDVEPDTEEQEGRFAAAVAWPRVLELYAGSGALAIEALSRGAVHADLVESNPDARRAIAANLAKTGLNDRTTVHAITCEKAVSTIRGPYDLILLDPPYDAEGVWLVLQHVVTNGLLAPGGVLIWEHAEKTEPPDHIGEATSENRLQLLRTRRHGAASVSLYASEVTA